MALRRLGVAVGDHEPSEPEARDVQPGLDREARRRQGLAGRLEGLGLTHDAREGAIPVSPTVIRGDDHRRLGHDHGRADCSADRVGDQAAGVLAGLEGVVVRIRAVPHQHRGALDHLRRDVGMEIEGHADGDGARTPAHRGDQVPLRIVLAFGQHRAVHGQDDPIDGKRGLKPPEHFSLQAAVALGGQRAVRATVSGEQRHWRHPELLTRGEDSGHLRPRPSEISDEFVAIQKVVGPKHVEGAAGRHEAVALLNERPDCESHPLIPHERAGRPAQPTGQDARGTWETPSGEPGRPASYQERGAVSSGVALL